MFKIEKRNISVDIKNKPIYTECRNKSLVVGTTVKFKDKK